MPEPGGLALRVLPGGDFRTFDRLVEGNGSRNRGLQFANTNCLHGRQIGVKFERDQCLHLLRPTVVEHLVETPVDPGDKG